MQPAAAAEAAVGTPPGPSTATARVAGLLPFSCVDGPGNRLVLFLQGCDFDCKVCHNPHTIPRESVKATTMTVQDVLDRVRQARAYLSGVTVSGGEATVQWEFVRDLFATLKADPDLAGLTTMVDSNGNAPIEVWRALAPVTDGAMIDLKALDPAEHEFLTGRSNTAVLASIRELAALGLLVEVRLLLIPGRNDSDEQLLAVADWLRGIDPNIAVRLNLFATHGVRSPARTWAPASQADRDHYASVLGGAGLTIVTTR